jgi:hypothetical protein
MRKRMLLASAVTGLLAGAAIPIHSTPADAARRPCSPTEATYVALGLTG